MRCATGAPRTKRWILDFPRRTRRTADPKCAAKKANAGSARAWISGDGGEDRTLVSLATLVRLVAVDACCREYSTQWVEPLYGLRGLAAGLLPHPIEVFRAARCNGRSMSTPADTERSLATMTETEALGDRRPAVGSSPVSGTCSECLLRAETAPRFATMHATEGWDCRRSPGVAVAPAPDVLVPRTPSCLRVREEDLLRTIAGTIAANARRSLDPFEHSVTVRMPAVQ